MKTPFLFLLLALPAVAAEKLALTPHQAALRIMNTFYQNCDSTKKPPYDVEKLGEMRGYTRLRNEVTKGSNSRVDDLAAARKSQYYISCQPPKKPAKSCRELCDAPPTYIWGGMGVYTKTPAGIELNVFANADHTQKLSGHPGLDCSGYMYASFATAGLRVHPEMPPSAETADTLTARTYMKQAGGCFNDVSLLEKSGLKAGDLIAWKSHLVMVDSAGKDPFGLRKIRKVADCTFEKLHPSSFDLVVLNSKGGTDPLGDETKTWAGKNPELRKRLEPLEKQITGVGVGLSKLYFRDLAVVAPQPVMELALAACFAKFAQDLPVEKTINQKPWRETINVVRHRLTEKGAVLEKTDPCLARADETVSLTGFECVRACSP